EVTVEPGPPWTVRTSEIIATVLGDMSAAVPIEVIAARFHNTLAAIMVAVCEAIREQHDLTTVALSGGVFQNEFLFGASCLHAGKPGLSRPPPSSGTHQRRWHQPRPSSGGGGPRPPSLVGLFPHPGQRSFLVILRACEIFRFVT